MNGQIGLPQRWCAMSQQACISQPMPMNRDERRPANAIGVVEPISTIPVIPVPVWIVYEQIEV